MTGIGESGGSEGAPGPDGARGARLALVTEGDSFAEYWEAVAGRLEVELARSADPGSVPRAGTFAVVLVVAGREDRAVELLHEAHRVGLDGPVVVGAEADHRMAVELMRRGADAYFALPGDAGPLEDDLGRRLEAVRERARRRKGSGEGPAAESHRFPGLVGEAPEFRAALERAARLVPRGDATVLLTGETGTGKELLARALHDHGPRSDEAFVPVNCSAIPGRLLESELFGHEKGAFTDARTAKPGLFHVADGGTLFLDEVATLPLELQGKLLRVLESGEVRRLGGLEETLVDVRIIAAANVDLRDRVREGTFREDLYYRLAVVPVHLPPLRERPGDVERLARHFLAGLAERYGTDVPELSAPALRALERHRWPGNVRELRNAMERALLLSEGEAVGPGELALEETSTEGDGDGAPATSGPGELPFPATLEELEEEAVRAMIRRTGGNKSEAARRLEIPRSRLYRILDRGKDEGDDRG